MDVDISDILADISRPTQATTSSGLSGTTAYSIYDGDSAYTDHILLTRAWTSERCIPTLLPYPTTLITRVMDRIRAQISKIEDLTAGIYDGYSTSGQPPGQANLNLILSILQTDLSRTQFLMRSYLRQRLSKISRHATYYAQYHIHSAADVDDTKTPLLSTEEIQFLQHHQNLLGNLYNSSFLMSLPVNLRRLNDSTGGTARMDEGPDAAGGVMVRCLAKEWSNERDVFGGEEEVGSTQKGDEKPSVELRVERGGVLVARWKDVRRGVESGDLEVL